MAKKSFIITCIAASIICSSCFKDDPAGSSTSTFPETIIPLSVNNSWDYTYLRYNYLGEITYTSDTVLTVVRDTIFNNSRWFKFNDWEKVFKEIFWYKQNSQGLAMLYSLKGQFDSLTLFHYPPKLGPDSASGWSIIDIDTVITSEIGNYNCILYRNGIKDYFVSPGVGIIKIIAYYPTNPGEPNYPNLRFDRIYILKQYVIN